MPKSLSGSLYFFIFVHFFFTVFSIFFRLAKMVFVFVGFLLFSIFFRLAKMACTSSVSCSSHATVRYTMEQAVNMVVDDQSPNVLTADSDSGIFLCWLYHRWIVYKLCKNTKHVHSINSMTLKSNFNLKINQPMPCSMQLSLNWCMDEYDWMSSWDDTAV